MGSDMRGQPEHDPPSTDSHREDRPAEFEAPLPAVLPLWGFVPVCGRLLSVTEDRAAIAEHHPHLVLPLAIYPAARQDGIPRLLTSRFPRSTLCMQWRWVERSTLMASGRHA